MNLDKLAIGASKEHVIDKICDSDRYAFIEGNLMDENLVIDVLKNNQVFFFNTILYLKFRLTQLFILLPLRTLTNPTQIE